MKKLPTGELEKRIAELEHQVEHLLRLSDLERAPFSYLVVETGITDAQENEIYNLMEDFSNYIKAGRKIPHHDFEQELYKIMPSKNGDYHFAETVVASLNDEDRFTDVYEALKKSGMNI